MEALDGFEKPFTRNVTVIKGERAVADFYYPRESYEATVNYNVNGVTIKTVTYRLKYEQPIPTPAMDGYTLASEWTETTMPADDNFTLNVEFTPRDDTLYAVEHYVQQPDGSYALHSREEKRGITGAQPKFDLLSLDSSYDSDYDDTLTIAGDGSTVVKVRYTLKDLHTATFYNEDKVTIGKAYYYEGDTIRVPQSVLDSKPGYRPVWPDDASFVGPGYDKTFTVESWTPALDTQYTVVHMEQDPDNPEIYTEVSREEMTGVTGDQVTVNLLTHDPAQFKEGDYDDSLTIAGDGSTEVKVTYDRCKHTLTYDLNADDATFTDGGSSQKTLTVLYGAALTPPGSADVQREGYGLVGWKSADGVDFTTGKTMPASNLTLLAQWQAGTQYKVVSTYESTYLYDYGWSDGPVLNYSDIYDETETTYGVAAEGSGDTVTVTATPRAGYVTPDPVELNLNSPDPTVEFTYERITYDITVYDVSTGTPYKLYDVSGVRSGTDLTTVQLKWGYMPKMLYTDPQCKEPYNPDYAGGEHLDLYVRDWDGVVYSLKVWYDNYRSSADFDYWWDALEERGVKLSEVDPDSPSRTLYIKYGEGTTMPDADEVDIPISIRYVSYSSEAYGEYVTKLTPGQEFDDVFAGNSWIDGTVQNDLFRERGGDPETGAAQMIYNAGDFFEIGRDIELGIVNFQLADDIYFDNDDFIVISNYSIDCDVPITIDGNGKTLYNFTNTEGLGLFTSLAGGSMIQDLNIDGFKVSGTQPYYSSTNGLGLLVCDVLPSPDDSSTPGRITLRNISVTNSTLECSKEGMYVGGLVGWCGSADLDNCSVDGTVKITATGENVPGVGAFVGYAQDGADIDAACTNGTTLPNNVGATA